VSKPPSQDPRFRKTVPQSFYDNEKRQFGALPTNWEVGMKNGKNYYVK